MERYLVILWDSGTRCESVHEIDAPDNKSAMFMAFLELALKLRDGCYPGARFGSWLVCHCAPLSFPPERRA